MLKPQRHRLLHGFPLAAAMPYASQEVRWLAAHGDPRFCPPRHADRGLLIGVLPHSFCNPKVAACGFCTFPHEQFNSRKAAEVVAAVIQEIDDRVCRENDLECKAIKALYFGGGTANLTPAEPFRQLCRKLNDVFDLRQAEVTLEGVPAYFLKRKPLLVDILREELEARHFRISMGIQTFSRHRLKQMGRLAFGEAETFSRVVEVAHVRDMTVSGDLLFNLPGQSLSEMCRDMSQAVEIGLDQICLYHLVMFRGLGAPWAKDDQLLESLPDNPTAEVNWLCLRQHLLEQGFHQTTLTNFERNAFRRDSRRYVYELASFEPDRYDMLGFGPAGISYTASQPDLYALKTMNPESSAEYVQAVNRKGPVWNRYYGFGLRGLRLLQATRNLAGLRIDRTRYRQALGSDVSEDFPEEIEGLQQENLLHQADRCVAPTPRGIFYADTIAGVLAARQLGRLGGDLFRSATSEINDNRRGYM